MPVHHTLTHPHLHMHTCTLPQDAIMCMHPIRDVSRPQGHNPIPWQHGCIPYKVVLAQGLLSAHQGQELDQAAGKTWRMRMWWTRGLTKEGQVVL